MRESKSDLSKSLCVIMPATIFVLFALAFIFSKSLDLNRQAELLRAGGTLTEYQLGTMETIDLPASLRIGTGLAYLTVETLFGGLATMVLNDPTSSAGFPGEGWGFGFGLGGGFRLGEMNSVLVPIISSIAWKILALLPLFLLATTAFASTLLRSVYVMICMMILIGWPDELLNAYFSFMRLFIDWPIAYFLFSTAVQPYDIGAIFFVNALIFYMLSCNRVTLTHVAVLAAVGQLIFENLGFVTGVSLFIWTALSERHDNKIDWRLAFQRLFVAGVVSVTILSTMVGYSYYSLPTVFESYHDNVLDSTAPGASNFVNPRFTAALFIIFFTFPILFGCLLGAIAGWVASTETFDRRRRAFYASIAVSVAFGMTLLIGFPISGYLSDLGRQAMAGATACFAAAVFGGEVFARKYLRPRT